jgi:hypothetical protein
MSASSGDAHPFPIFNARFRVIFPIFDADGDLVIGAASLDTELSQDTGTFADATNEATEIATSSGMYYLDLVAGELDTKSTTAIVKTATAGAKTSPLILYPKRLPVIRTGTAQAGSGSTITLDSGASALDDFYNGCYVNITNNSPSNAQGQARRITDYVGSTRVATVEAAWGTNPSSASTFEILAPGDTVNVAQWAGTQVASPTVAGTPKADTSLIEGVDATDQLATALAVGAITGAVVDDVLNSSTTFETNLSQATNDHFLDAWLVFTSGTLSGQVKKITDYDGTTKFVTVSGGFTAEPTAADAFQIVNGR